jgi:CheY-like chemotaxis protein
VTGGRAALELFREDPQHFDAVILDLNMPGLDGLQTWEKLRRLRPRLPTVFCSADLAYFGNQLPGCECVRALNKPYSSEGVKKVALALQEVIDLCGS